MRLPRARSALLSVLAAVALVAGCSSGKHNETNNSATGPGPTLTQTPPSASGDALIAAAKAEGVVRVSGPKGLPAFQDALTKKFTEQYGIEVDYSGEGSKTVTTAMLGTPNEKVFPYDVLVGGYDTMVMVLNQYANLRPIGPVIQGSGNEDPGKWKGNALPYDNKARTGLGFLRQSGQYIYVDSSKIDVSSIKSYKDLLGDNVKGSILLAQDPREEGTGSSLFGFFLKTKDLGEAYVRSFLTDKRTVIIKDDDDAEAKVAKAEFDVCICNNSQGTELTTNHKSFVKIDPHQLAEGTTTTSSFSNLAIPARVAHPNAMKLYVNWLLSEPTQEAAARATLVPSQRTDVPTDYIPPAYIPELSWPSGANEAAEADAEAAQKVAIEILGPMASS